MQGTFSLQITVRAIQPATLDTFLVIPGAFLFGILVSLLVPFGNCLSLWSLMAWELFTGLISTAHNPQQASGCEPLFTSLRAKGQIPFSSECTA